jgi:hypothetical protein
MRGFGPFVVGAIFGFIIGPHVSAWLKKHTTMALPKTGYYY